MPEVHRYRTSCDVEKRWAPVLDDWLSDYYEIREATLEEQWRGIDRVSVDDEGQATSIDYKCDEKAASTGNAFIEVVSNQESGRRGWAETSEATWLFYFVVPSRVLVFTFARLRRVLPAWSQRYPTRPAANEGYTTLGICVPLAVAEKATEYVAHLNHGDAAILQRRGAAR